MAGQEAQLLRMLEPAVRPTGAAAPAAPPKVPDGAPSFRNVLDGLIRPSSGRPVDLSAHAQQRLDDADIAMTPDRLQALAEAVDRADAKGARDALVLMSDVNLIVNVPNRTVVTALTEDRLREGVVTQIDAAVFAAEPSGPSTPALERLNALT